MCIYTPVAYYDVSWKISKGGNAISKANNITQSENCATTHGLYIFANNWKLPKETQNEYLHASVVSGWHLPLDCHPTLTLISFSTS
jgi:hypothetical protein